VFSVTPLRTIGFLADDAAEVLAHRDRHIGRADGADLDRAGGKGGAHIGVADEVHHLDLDAEGAGKLCHPHEGGDMRHLHRAHGELHRRVQRARRIDERDLRGRLGCGQGGGQGQRECAGQKQAVRHPRNPLVRQSLRER
jgi:hypothetical protein